MASFLTKAPPATHPLWRKGVIFVFTSFYIVYMLSGHSRAVSRLYFGHFLSAKQTFDGFTVHIPRTCGKERPVFRVNYTSAPLTVRSSNLEKWACCVVRDTCSRHRPYVYFVRLRILKVICCNKVIDFLQILECSGLLINQIMCRYIDLGINWLSKYCFWW